MVDNTSQHFIWRGCVEVWQGTYHEHNETLWMFITVVAKVHPVTLEAIEINQDNITINMSQQAQLSNQTILLYVLALH